ncbi:hypothetical protein ELS19_06150 [Halogeometricum borinquense]|uniref:Uncharacterized protein n=1 Tax=Halogeometricum borinquense TaxID=60847 RepID=A0A482TEF1_9EURY|nr:hypothetical protein [Halogeometricum borinquense]RYJ13578.1 hypothetical protein ELS19_06150 [Halogeometricum borinquense]
MLQSYWFALAVFAAGSTYLWAFRSDRLVLTTAFSASAWAVLALSGGSVTRKVVDGGSTVTVEAPTGDALQLFVAGLALLSLLAHVLVQIGGYPPEQARSPDAAPKSGLGFDD